MSNRKPRSNTKIKPPTSPQVVVRVAETKSASKKVVVTTGDKNAQVLAATVGGAVIGNLIVPGVGGAIFGGIIGALVGNSSQGKGSK